MILSIDNKQEFKPVPLFARQEIVIGIDASKTNTALAIGNMSGELLHWIELNGSGDGTSEYDALKLCKKHRDTLKVLFKDSIVKLVGIEDIITKVTKGKETGMTVHTSRFKITCIFASLIAFFQDNFEITPMLINNWTWKSHILPENFRSRDIGKGSLAYFKSINSPLGNCTDDVTDAVCILRYLYKYSGIQLGIKIYEPEVQFKKYNAMLVSDLEKTDLDARIFLYNSDMTLEQNMIVISNNVDDVGKARVEIKDLSLADIYKYCRGDFKKYEEELTLWVLNEKR